MPEKMRLLPPVPVLAERLAEVDLQLRALELRLTTPMTHREMAGALAHQGALLRRRQWYLGRIRAQRPVQQTEISVGDEIQMKEAM